MRKAAVIKLDISARKELERLSRSRRVAVRLAERSRIVLLAAKGLNNQEIGAELDIHPSEGRAVARSFRGTWPRRNRKGRCPKWADSLDQPSEADPDREEDGRREAVERHALEAGP